MIRRTFILTLSIAAVSCAGLHHVPKDADVPTPLNTPIAPTVIVTGTVSDSGVECPVVRGSDGKDYSVATNGKIMPKSGTHVRVAGSVAQVSMCQQGTTIRATSIDNLSATVADPTTQIAPSTKK